MWTTIFDFNAKKSEYKTSAETHEFHSFHIVGILPSFLVEFFALSNNMLVDQQSVIINKYQFGSLTVNSWWTIMSLWDRVSKLPSNLEKIKNLYNENFPLEVRIVCAQWIEDRVKADQYIDINDPQYEQRAANFMHNLIQQLEQEKLKFHKPGEVSIKYRLEEAIRTFTQHIYNPVQLYKHIRDALMYEHQILESCANNPQVNYMDTEAIKIGEDLKSLHQLIMMNGENCSRYKHELEQYMINFSEGTKRIQELNNLQSTPEVVERQRLIVDEYKLKMQQMTESINARRVELYANIRNVTESLNEVQKVVIHKRLGKWQRDQALAGNGAPVPMSALDEIQGWFENLADLIWSTRTLIDTIRKTNLPIQGPGNGGDLFEAAYREVTTLLQNLIVSGFIVEKQPPQVMKTNTRWVMRISAIFFIGISDSIRLHSIVLIKNR